MIMVNKESGQVTEVTRERRDSYLGQVPRRPQHSSYITGWCMNRTEVPGRDAAREADMATA